MSNSSMFSQSPQRMCNSNDTQRNVSIAAVLRDTPHGVLKINNSK